MTLAQPKAASGRPGSVMFDKPAKSLNVTCGDGSVLLQKLKPAGGKEMDAASFWNGLRDRESVILGENRKEVE